MSGRLDDSELEQLVPGAADVSQRYRESSNEEPSAQLDDAIRAAARREVKALPRLAGSPFSRSGRVPLAVAAVVIVSVTVSMLIAERGAHLPKEDSVRALAEAPRTPSSLASPPAAAPKEQGRAEELPFRREAQQALRAPKSKAASGEADTAPLDRAEAVRENETPPAFPAPPAKQTDDAAAARKKESASVLRDENAAAPAPEPFPQTRGEAATATPTDDRLGAGHSSEGVPAEAKADAAPPVMANEARAPAPSAPPPPSAATLGRLESDRKLSAQSGFAPAPGQPSQLSARPWEEDPAAWLRYVDVLRQLGRADEAHKQFLAFRRRYPDYPLPTTFVVPGAAPR